MADMEAAPVVRTRSLYVDKRAALVDKLDREHPEFKHVFRSANVEKSDLAVSDQEIVYEDTYGGGGSGGVGKARAKPMGWRRDIIARMKRSVYDEGRRAHSDMAASDVEALYNRNSGNEAWRDNKPGKKVAKAKKPGEQDGG